MVRTGKGELIWSKGSMHFDDDYQIDKDNFEEAMKFLWDYRSFPLLEWEVRHYLTRIYLYYKQKNGAETTIKEDNITYDRTDHWLTFNETKI